MQKQHLKNRLFFWTEAYKKWIVWAGIFDLKNPEEKKLYDDACKKTEKEKEEIIKAINLLRG